LNVNGPVRAIGVGRPLRTGAVGGNSCTCK
jgi:hypothetical protein